nr:MAG TPA: hypothetical protein [Caudoviricetes sp.]
MGLFVDVNKMPVITRAASNLLTSTKSEDNAR